MRPLFVAVGVLCIHTAAFAQQPRAPAKAAPKPPETAPKTPAPGSSTAPAQPPQQPPPPAPPPSYPYGPPPGYAPPTPDYDSYPPYEYVPVPPPVYRGVYRPFSIDLGLGIGMLTFNESPGGRTDVAGGWNARLGFGLSRNWLVNIQVEKAFASQPDVDVDQLSLLIGAQYFIMSRLYARAGLGFVTIDDDYGGGVFDSDNGQAVGVGAGFEAVQGHSVALALEWSGLASWYQGENWLQNLFLVAIHFY